MEKFSIHGGRRLDGEIRISGAKNAALPILAATLLTDDTLRIRNVPDLQDITTMIDLLASMGVVLRRDERHGLEADAASISSFTAPY